MPTSAVNLGNEAKADYRYKMMTFGSRPLCIAIHNGQKEPFATVRCQVTDFTSRSKLLVARLFLAAHGKDKNSVDFGNVTVQSYIAM